MPDDWDYDRPWTSYIRSIANAAYGLLKLRPWEFYRLTAYEYEDLMAGWSYATDIRRRHEALWVANLMNATGNMKEPVTPDALMTGTAAGKAMDMDKIRARAEERKQERLREREKVNRASQSR